MKLPAARQITLLLVAVAAFGAQAQYKVVGPDGSVTYTDRPPADPRSRVTTLGARGAGEASSSLQLLPPDLRQAAQRFPVTLYVAANCSPCDPARAMLRQRGIPFAEKLITSNEEIAQLQRIVGSQGVPAVTIGSQSITGLNSEAWNSYLDAAGYPRESKLPANYQYPAVTPLIERPQAAPKPAAEPAADETPAAPPPPSGIKF